MSEPDDTTRDAPAERHASWLELFFDLVVVVAVAQVSHRLHDPSWAELGISLLLFGAIWFSWVSFTLYANVRAHETRTRAMLLAMAGIAVMAAAAQEADGERAVAFAVAYLAVRYLATLTWRNTGSLLLAWPTVQVSSGLVPWVVSLWVDGPGRYVLWAVGLAADVITPALGTRGMDEQQFQAKIEERLAARGRNRGRGHERRDREKRADDPRRVRSGEPATFSIARLDTEHLGERLGLFVIIVLGEAVYRLVSVAAEAEWTAELVTVGAAGFVVVVGLWWLTFQYGFAASPHARIAELPARFALPVHMLSTAGLMVMAAGLGALAEHPEGEATPATGALLCGGLAAYFTVQTVASIMEKAPRRWVFGWGVPTVVAAAGLAVASSHLPVVAVVVALVAVVGWQIAYPLVTRRLAPA